MTLAPKLLMTLWMMILPTDTELCCRMLGTAMTAILPSIRQEKRAGFSGVEMASIRRATASRASTQLMPWQRKVAQATPATPMSKAVTKKISIKMLPTDEAARKKKGVRLSPSAEKMPVATL